MKFPDLLIEALRRAEIPLRFEPGAEEAAAKPVTELIRVWLAVHEAEAPALVSRLLAELDGAADVPE